MATTSLTGWGAFLSTYRYSVPRIPRSPRLKVDLQIEELAERPTQIVGTPNRNVVALVAIVANPSRMEVRLEHDCCELEMRGSKRWFGVDPEYSEPAQLPTTIAPGQNRRIIIPAQELIETIRHQFGYVPKIRIHIHDVIGQSYSSEWIELPCISLGSSSSSIINPQQLRNPSRGHMFD